MTSTTNFCNLKKPSSLWKKSPMQSTWSLIGYLDDLTLDFVTPSLPFITPTLGCSEQDEQFYFEEIFREDFPHNRYTTIRQIKIIAAILLGECSYPPGLRYRTSTAKRNITKISLSTENLTKTKTKSIKQILPEPLYLIAVQILLAALSWHFEKPWMKSIDVFRNQSNIWDGAFCGNS